MRTISLIFSSTIIGLVLFSFCNTAYALEDIGQSRLHPASPFYFLKTIRESLELKFAGTRKVVYIRRLEFATRRLREVKSLIQVGNFELIIPALENYSSQINSLPDQGLQEKEILQLIENNLSNHLEVLQQIYYQIENPRAKMAIRAAINRILQRADLPPSARLLGCSFLSKEASSSALNEVEKTVLLERVKKCFQSL